MDKDTNLAIVLVTDCIKALDARLDLAREELKLIQERLDALEVNKPRDL